MHSMTRPSGKSSSLHSFRAKKKVLGRLGKEPVKGPEVVEKIKIEGLKAKHHSSVQRELEI